MPDTYDSNESRYRAEAKMMTRDRLEAMYEACTRLAPHLVTGDPIRDLSPVERQTMTHAPRPMLEAAYIAAHLAVDVAALSLVMRESIDARPRRRP